MIKVIKIPKSGDWDVILEFSNGETLEIEGRKSNSDTNYNGSLDIILPNNTNVTLFEGDNLKNAVPDTKIKNCLLAKQLVAELPY